MITQENIPYTADEIKAMVKTCEKYNKAREIAKECLQDGTITTIVRDYIWEIFPELKEKESEDEDEKARKELIAFLEENLYLGYPDETWDSKGLKRWIAWLEKQEEPKDKGEISDGYHTFNELYRYRMLYNAAFFNMLPKHMTHKSKKHHDGEECFGGGWFIVVANLPTGQISNHYELKDWDLFQIPEKEVADEWDGHTPQDAADRLHKYLLERQGENKHTDKAEPKFKVGDWITDGHLTCKVLSVTGKSYELHLYNDDYCHFETDVQSVDKHYRLWTIEDAKDGDVLINWNNTAFIFKAIEDETVQFHIAYNEKWDDTINTPTTKFSHLGLPEPEFGFHPATKEQRDLLFQKMKEAGYEWDSEKKQLSILNLDC